MYRYVTKYMEAVNKSIRKAEKKAGGKMFGTITVIRMRITMKIR